MNRRQFLTLGGASALAFAVPSTWGWARPPLKPEALARPALLSMLGDPARVRELGRRYRSSVPGENGRKALIAALRNDLEPGLPLTAASRLEEQVRADFAAGRIVTLKGWVLSRTEARQCALFSLS